MYVQPAIGPVGPLRRVVYHAQIAKTKSETRRMLAVHGQAVSDVLHQQYECMMPVRESIAYTILDCLDLPP